MNENEYMKRMENTIVAAIDRLDEAIDRFIDAISEQLNVDQICQRLEQLIRNEADR